MFRVWNLISWFRFYTVFFFNKILVMNQNKISCLRLFFTCIEIQPCFFRFIYFTSALLLIWCNVPDCTELKLFDFSAISLLFWRYTFIVVFQTTIFLLTSLRFHSFVDVFTIRNFVHSRLLKMFNFIRSRLCRNLWNKIITSDVRR